MLPAETSARGQVPPWNSCNRQCSGFRDKSPWVGAGNPIRDWSKSVTGEVQGAPGTLATGRIAFAEGLAGHL